MLVHVVRVLGPGLSFGNTGAVLGLGGDDATHAHANDEQVLVVFPEALELVVAEALAGTQRVNFLAVQRLGAEDIAHARNGGLVHEDHADGASALAGRAVEAFGVGVGVERVRAQLGADGAHLLRGEHTANGGPNQVGPAVLRNDAATHGALRFGRTGVGLLLPRRVFLLTNLAGRADARGARKRLVAPEGPVAIDAQVHVQGQLVIEGDEQVLAVRVGAGDDVPVQQGRPIGEASLRGADAHALAGEDVTDLAGDAVDGVAFGHGFSSKTCRLEIVRIIWSAETTEAHSLHYAPQILELRRRQSACRQSRRSARTRPADRYGVRDAPRWSRG